LRRTSQGVEKGARESPNHYGKAAPLLNFRTANSPFFAPGALSSIQMHGYGGYIIIRTMKQN